ncbi:SMI1/KNR4 family protein [uncultured Imperialibacter sp.]|uniref:SMI1/KNR4 family protein n=1 Tax=uncultured Imperialibacter sp. TaxID=1672639 RepID=UPI0030D945F4|tara:strand:- start:26199 stop:26591 length:393 start_codon:yes stop_codon:yes gene_type:complete
MPFPVELKYIEQTESELGVKFPKLFKQRMMQANGGATCNEEFQIFPFWDKSDRKRIARTSNHIGLETKNAKDWPGFPERTVVIGSDGTGDLLIFQHHGDGELEEVIYLWDHETGAAQFITKDIIELDANF